MWKAIVVVLSLASCCSGSNDSSSRSPFVYEERIRPDHCMWSVLYFDTVGY